MTAKNKIHVAGPAAWDVQVDPASAREAPETPSVSPSITPMTTPSSTVAFKSVLPADQSGRPRRNSFTREGKRVLTDASAKALSTVVPTADIQEVDTQRFRPRNIRLGKTAGWIALTRRRNFTVCAMLALLAGSIITFGKYFLAVQGEHLALERALQETAASAAQGLQLQIAADMQLLGSVGNLWSMDSRMDRNTLRAFVTSARFAPYLETAQTVILVERVLPWQRGLVETHPMLLATRRDCCEGTLYDTETTRCRDKASQCKLAPRENATGTFHIVARTPDKTFAPAEPREADEDYHLVITHQEPLEKNPGPLGLDFRSLKSRFVAWEQAAMTGSRAMTQRMERVYSPGEFGLLVFDPLYSDASDRNRSALAEPLQFFTKEELERQGKEAYAHAAVVSVYEATRMFTNVMQALFDHEFEDVCVYLFDQRPSTPDENRLLGFYETGRSAEALKQALFERKATTPADVLGEAIRVPFSLRGFGALDLELVAVPNPGYYAGRTSSQPLLIVVVSLVVLIVAQTDRWFGHPVFVADDALDRMGKWLADSEPGAGADPERGALPA